MEENFSEWLAQHKRLWRSKQRRIGGDTSTTHKAAQVSLGSFVLRGEHILTHTLQILKIEGITL